MKFMLDTKDISVVCLRPLLARSSNSIVLIMKLTLAYSIRDGMAVDERADR